MYIFISAWISTQRAGALAQKKALPKCFSTYPMLTLILTHPLSSYFIQCITQREKKREKVSEKGIEERKRERERVRENEERGEGEEMRGREEGDTD
eukprot:1334695-Amorphochlora_amoeboformis.AAC.1